MVKLKKKMLSDLLFNMHTKHDIFIMFAWTQNKYIIPPCIYGNLPLIYTDVKQIQNYVKPLKLYTKVKHYCEQGKRKL